MGLSEVGPAGTAEILGSKKQIQAAAARIYVHKQYPMLPCGKQRHGHRKSRCARAAHSTGHRDDTPVARRSLATFGQPSNQPTLGFREAGHVLRAHLYRNSPRIRFVIAAHHKDAIATGTMAPCDVP